MRGGGGEEKGKAKGGSGGRPPFCKFWDPPDKILEVDRLPSTTRLLNGSSQILHLSIYFNLLPYLITNLSTIVCAYLLN